MPSDVPRVRPDDDLRADWANQLVDAVNGLQSMSVDGSTMELLWVGGAPLLRAFSPAAFAWFYTTSTITTASASATGTALGSATLTYGGGTARRCVKAGSGAGATYKPDANASNQAIVNGVVYTTAIATGSFCLCVEVEGDWVVVLVARCPGT